MSLDKYKKYMQIVSVLTNKETAIELKEILDNILIEWETKCNNDAKINQALVSVLKNIDERLEAIEEKLNIDQNNNGSQQ